MKITTYEEAVEYLESFIGKVRFEITPEFLKQHDPLERMRVLLNLLGNPQDKFSSVLVGGTSGKGSTAYLLSHILKTSGYKAGFTISPHLQKINERLQINGKEISDKKFTEMVNSLVQTIELMGKMKVGEPSYFEILIAMAFLYFVQQQVKIAVVEVGMGGEFDATNTLSPLIAVLTNVGLDHTNILGKTVQRIARTKAGIIKKIKDLRLKIKESKENHKSLIINHQSPIVISGVKQPSVIKIVEERCKKVGAKFFRLGKDFDFKIKKESLEGTVFDLIIFSDRRKRLNDLGVSLLGRYQVENASLAIEVVLQLKKFGFSVSEEHIRQGLKTAFFPGRFEIIKIDSLLRRVSLAQDKTSSTLVLDGAHNPTKMKAFLSTLKKLFPKQKKIFIVGFKFDKDIPKMLKQILRVADTLIVTEFRAKTDISNNASAEALNLKSQISNLKSGAKVVIEKDSKKALEIGIKTIQQYRNSAIIVVTGSLYLVGEIRDYIMKNPKS